VDRAGGLAAALTVYLKRLWEDPAVTVRSLEPMPGGASRETWSF
jgi:hypothetical protein